MTIKNFIKFLIATSIFFSFYGLSRYKINKSIKEYHKLLDRISFSCLYYNLYTNVEEYKNKKIKSKIDSIAKDAKEKIDSLLENYYNYVIKSDKLSHILMYGEQLGIIEDIILNISLKEKNTRLAEKIIFKKLKETHDERYIKKLEKLIEIIKKENKGKISLVEDVDIFYKKLAYTTLYENTKNEKYRKILQELEKEKLEREKKELEEKMKIYKFDIKR